MTDMPFEYFSSVETTPSSGFIGSPMQKITESILMKQKQISK